MKTVNSLFDILSENSIRVVLFDLDDTLSPEESYCFSCFSEVGDAMELRFGINDAYAKLKALFAKDKGRVFNRLLDQENIVYTENDIKSLLEIYKNHFPAIALTDEKKVLLEELRRKGYRLGIITDGNPIQQENKINALGLSKLVDKIIITDKLGGSEFRKPNPCAFLMMKEHFDVNFEEMLYIGDNPKKDFAVKAVYPIITAQVGGGYYSHNDYKDGIMPDYFLEEAFLK